MKKADPDIFLFVALNCEAKPLIHYFQLKKVLDHSVFSIYINAHVTLTITGIGKLAMAGGVAYTLAHFSPVNNPILLNIGIAGHAFWATGSLMLATKITDLGNNKSFFPQLLPDKISQQGEVCTLSSPSTAYRELAAYDMEAAGFYEMATKFSSLELIHCLKIVSDNADASINKINAKQVETWIYQQLSTIESVLEQLIDRQQMIMPYQLEQYQQLLNKWHFSVSGKIQLKVLLTRWQVLTGKPWSNPVELSFQTSKQVLKKLTEDINHLTIDL